MALRLYPEHDVGLDLGGLSVRRVEEDGSVITIRVTPLRISYRRVENGREYAVGGWVSPKWLIILLHHILRKDYTKFFFWATFLASRKQGRRENFTRKRGRTKTKRLGALRWI